MIDTHVHLTDGRFDADRAAVRERMARAGVRRHLEVGTDLLTNRAAQAAAAKNFSVLASAGLHPHGAADPANASYRDALPRQLSLARVAAVGECGLDFFRNLSAPDAQKEVFAFQIALARARGLPLVVHERAAWTEVLACLDAGNAAAGGGVFHCFSHGRREAEEALARGFVLGLGGTTTRGEAWTRELLPWVPLERVVLETDSPYLAPQPLPRSRRNEPAHLPLVARAIAEARGVDVTDVVRVTTENALRLFASRDTWEETPELDPARADGALVREHRT